GVERAVTVEVRRLCGLDFDLAGFYRVAKADAALAPLVEPLYGLRPTLSPTPLEMLIGSISAQQVNLSFAFACRARLVRRWGTPVDTPGGVVYAFPAARARAAGERSAKRPSDDARAPGATTRTSPSTTCWPACACPWPRAEARHEGASADPRPAQSGRPARRAPRGPVRAGGHVGRRPRVH